MSPTITRKSLLRLAASALPALAWPRAARALQPPSTDRRERIAKSAAAWVHLGANIGAADGRTRVQASADDIEATALAALQRVGGRVDGRVPRGTVPSAEARNIHVGGGRYPSLLGSGPHFHNPDDLWPFAVDLEAVVRYAEATIELTLALATA